MSQLESLKFSDVPPKDAYEKDLEFALDKFSLRLREILNNGLNFSDNFNGYLTTITTSAAPGTETAIAHGLKRVPVGCIVIEKDKAAHIYLGASGKDATNYYVRSDVASVTATLLIV